MRKIIQEIRQQPLHIRKIFMWTSVAVVSSLVVFIGIRDTQKKFVALLNPKTQAETTALAAKEQNNNSTSPFGAIKKSLSNFQANISSFIGGNKKPESVNLTTPEPLKPQVLPVR